MQADAHVFAFNIEFLGRKITVKKIVFLNFSGTRDLSLTIRDKKISPIICGSPLSDKQ